MTFKINAAKIKIYAKCYTITIIKSKEKTINMEQILEGRVNSAVAVTAAPSLPAMLRTSKILFEPNCINQVKQTELSDFIDLCSDALNFYVVYFTKYYELDKLLFVGAKDKNNKIFAQNSNLTKLNNIFYELRYNEKKNRDCFGLKLKFYPDEILDILTNEKKYSEVAADAFSKNIKICQNTSDGDYPFLGETNFTKLSIWLFQ